MKCDFIEELADQPAGPLFYRPYLRKQEALEDASYLKRKFEDIRILEGSLDRAMLDFKLLVIDHPGTTLHRAVPGLCDAAMLWLPSVSSLIINTETGEQVSGLNVQRLYILVASASDIPRAPERQLRKPCGP